ncbi:hypothetical protein, partial [Pseudomonas syringae]|uniref:hypothetical protein n=1 Tax=Pseudomonas syringae TaxID=317 RepID=UPI001F34DBBE
MEQEYGIQALLNYYWVQVGPVTKQKCCMLDTQSIISLSFQRYIHVQLTLVPMLRVGMHWVTFRVTHLQPGAVSSAKKSQALALPVYRAGLSDAPWLQCDAERHEMHYHAEWYDPRRLDTTFGGIMGRYTEQAKLAAVQEYCAGKAGLRDVAH